MVCWWCLPFISSGAKCFKTLYTSTLLLFMIEHWDLSWRWCSRQTNLFQKSGWCFFIRRTLRTVSHLCGLVSEIFWTIWHSSSECLWYLASHFSEQIFKLQPRVQSISEILNSGTISKENLFVTCLCNLGVQPWGIHHAIGMRRNLQFENKHNSCIWHKKLFLERSVV